MKRDLYAEVSTRIVAELEAGAAPWIKPWSASPGANTPCNAVSNRPYSGCNVVLLWMGTSGRSAFKGADHFYNVAFHELTPWTAHKSRLDRNLKNRFGSRNYAAEELIAKLGAAFLCAELPLRVISGIRAISAPGLSF
jgi:antirestriction protein ArdC